MTLDDLRDYDPAPIEWVDDVPGWLTGPEGQTLFALGALARGPVLEVGPWLGRSTVCIARGIAVSPEPKEFFTVELNPKAEDWELRDGLYHFRPDDSDAAFAGGTPVEDWEEDNGPVVAHPEGVIGQLEANLRRCCVEELVQVVEGDFRHLPLHGPFAFIFTDTMHTPDEVHRNGQRLAELLAPGGVLACHDTTPENRAALGEFFDFDAETQVDSLFVGVAAT